MMLDGANILVTGATGLIGSFLAERLSTAGAHVIATGRDIDRNPDLKTLWQARKIRFNSCDLADADSIRSLCDEARDAEYVAHFASEAEPPALGFFEDALRAVELNLCGTIRLLSALPKVKGVCLASSMAVYGAPRHVPLDESCPAAPLDSYGASKFSLEKYMAIFGTSGQIPVALLRYSSIFGPRNRSTRAVPTFIKRALRGETLTIRGNGDTVRDYLFVDDAVDAAMSAIALGKSGIFNIGSGTPTRVIDLARLIVDLAGSSSRIEIREASKDFDFVYDISRAKKEFGFAPRTSLSDGLRMEIEWHRGLMTSN